MTTNIVMLKKDSIKPSVFAEVGTDVSKARSCADMVKQSGIGYELQFEPIRVRGKKVKNIYAITRDDTGHVFGICKKRYGVIQNLDAANRFHEIVSQTESKYRYAGLLNEGKTMWITAKLPETVKVNGHLIEFHIIMMNVHDGKHSGQISIVPIRQECNALLMATKRNSPNKVVINHNFDFDEQTKPSDVILMKDKYVGEMAKLFLSMSKRKVTDTERDQFFSMIVTNERHVGKNLSVRSGNKIAALTDFYLSHETMKGLNGNAFGLFASVAGYYQLIKNYERADKKLNNLIYEGDAIKDTMMAFHYATMLV